MTDIRCPRPPCMVCPWRESCPSRLHTIVIGDLIPWASLVGRNEEILDAHRRIGELRARGRASGNSKESGGL